MTTSSTIRKAIPMKRTLAAAAVAAFTMFGSVGIAGAAHQHVDNPSGCHDTASQAGDNSDGRSKWNKNGENKASANSPVVSDGTCESE